MVRAVQWFMRFSGSYSSVVHEVQWFTQFSHGFTQFSGS